MKVRRLRGSISPAAVDAIASAIQTQEGFYPGSLAWINNNPGNLAYAGQAGATRGAGGFAKFATLQDGQDALRNQIVLDATRGTDVNGAPTTTIAELLASWAPPSENDTQTYIANVAAATGFDPNAPLSSLGVVNLFSPNDVGQNLPATLDASISLPATVDFSAIGGPAAVPLPLAVGAGLVALLALRSL